jgi:hypothetical protein
MLNISINMIFFNVLISRSRGYGFVTYSQSYMVDQAMSNTPHRIDGHEVETKIALPRSV